MRKPYNNGLPRKSIQGIRYTGYKKKNKMISFDKTTLLLLDEKVPKGHQSSFVDSATKNKLKKIRNDNQTL